MKMLMMFPSQVRGGNEGYALTVATSAIERGWEVHVAFPQIRGTSSLIKDVVNIGAHYHSLNIGEFENRGLETRRRDFLRLIRTLRLLSIIRPDGVFLSLPWPDVGMSTLLASAVVNIPTIVVFQLVPHFIPIGEQKLRLYAWARKRHQQWICVSQKNRESLCDSFKVPENDVLRIYNGVPIIPDLAQEDYEERIVLRSQVREELGLPEKSRILLTVGRLHAQKGHADIIPIIPHITKEFRNATFVWAGEGPLKEDLLRKAGEYQLGETLVFLGHCTDIPRLLRAADVSIFPTHYEGLSFSLLEAMTSGIPVICSNASSNPEVITHSVDGLLFRTGDSCDLLETLRVALKDPEKMHKMAQQARISVKEFGQKNMLENTLSEFIKICSHSMLRGSI